MGGPAGPPPGPVPQHHAESVDTIPHINMTPHVRTPELWVTSAFSQRDVAFTPMTYTLAPLQRCVEMKNDKDQICLMKSVLSGVGGIW